MERDDGELLQVGEAVQCADYDARLTGVVVECLRGGYVRVRWADSAAPTTHRSYALQRIAWQPSRH